MSSNAERANSLADWSRIYRSHTSLRLPISKYWYGNRIRGCSAARGQDGKDPNVSLRTSSASWKRLTDPVADRVDYQAADLYWHEILKLLTSVLRTTIHKPSISAVLPDNSLGPHMQLQPSRRIGVEPNDQWQFSYSISEARRR